MILDQAIPAHAQWKYKFRSAIMKKERIDATIVFKDDCCLLGKWLHGAGATQFGHNPLFMRCLQKHADFHREAGEVAQAISEGRFDEADAMLNCGTAYCTAASDANAAIIGLKQDILATA